jgi:hypothetical protein
MIDTDSALREIFTKYSNTELEMLMGENYYTISSWKFKFKKHELSMEKKIEILTKLNYKVWTNLTWQKPINSK